MSSSKALNIRSLIQGLTDSSYMPFAMGELGKKPSGKSKTDLIAQLKDDLKTYLWSCTSGAPSQSIAAPISMLGHFMNKLVDADKHLDWAVNTTMQAQGDCRLVSEGTLSDTVRDYLYYCANQEEYWAVTYPAYETLNKVQFWRVTWRNPISIIFQLNAQDTAFIQIFNSDGSFVEEINSSSTPSVSRTLTEGQYIMTYTYASNLLFKSGEYPFMVHNYPTTMSSVTMPELYISIARNWDMFTSYAQSGSHFTCSFYFRNKVSNVMIYWYNFTGNYSQAIAVPGNNLITSISSNQNWQIMSPVICGVPAEVIHDYKQSSNSMRAFGWDTTWYPTDHMEFLAFKFATYVFRISVPPYYSTSTLNSQMVKSSEIGMRIQIRTNSIIWYDELASTWFSLTSSSDIFTDTETSSVTTDDVIDSGAEFRYYYTNGNETVYGEWQWFNDTSFTN